MYVPACTFLPLSVTALRYPLTFVIRLFLAGGEGDSSPFLPSSLPRPAKKEAEVQLRIQETKKPAAGTQSEAKHYQGDLLMDNENKSTPNEEDLLTGTIQLLAAKVKADASPDELERLKRLIKKNVPFTLRGYFMAYLLREILQANNPRRANSRETARPAKVKRESKAPSKAEEPQAKPQEKVREEKALPEGARTLYLNIGKMKRLYAKELSQLLQTELEITRDDIYSIRIHDKYSFISMSEENCEKAIAKLNGVDIKGRTAAISYSNKE